MTKSLAQQRSAKARPRGEETRRRLVEAAIAVVAERGWEQVTTRRIAERAGANQALINYHFGSKDGLLRAALMAAMREGFTAPVEALLDAPSFADGAAALVRELGQMDAAEPVVRFSMEALARAPRDEELRHLVADLLADLRARLAQAITSAKERGELAPSVDPAGAAALLGAAFDGLGLHLLIDPSLDLGPAGATVREMLTGTREHS